MKLKLQYNELNAEIEAKDAADALSQFKGEVAARSPLLLRGVIRSMGDVSFAQEVVKRHNAAHGRGDDLPASAQQFLDWAVERGYATILPSQS
jgi:hypothetical protein